MRKEERDDLKRLIFADDIVQKNLINESLIQNGIIAISKSSGLGGTFGYSVSGEELYVKKSDYDKAIKVLQELETQEVDQEELEKIAVSVAPDEEEINIEEVKFAKILKEFPKKIAILLVAIIAISMLFLHKR